MPTPLGVTVAVFSAASELNRRHAVVVDDRYQAVDIDVKKTEGVTITFADGFVAEFNLVSLRLQCPCAECRSLRDRDQKTWPLPSSPIPLEISTAALHGAWGLSPTWNDGHSAGVYPFEALRQWAEPRAVS